MDERQDGVESLTPRQLEILRLFGKNWQGKEVARHLGISERTVKTHTDAARRKLGVATTRDAARMLAEHEARQGPVDAPIVPDGPRPSGTMDDAPTDTARSEGDAAQSPIVPPQESAEEAGEEFAEESGDPKRQTTSKLEAWLASISLMGWLGLILVTAIASALVVAGLIGGILGLLDVMARLNRVLPD